MLENIIYQKTLSHDKSMVELPPTVYVTEENNGFFVWIVNDYDGTMLVDWDKFSRHRAIELGVDYGRMSEEEVLDFARKNGANRRKK